MTVDRELVPLRRTIQPYVGQFVILLSVAVFVIYELIKTSQWNYVWGTATFIPLYLIFILYIGMKYRVFWDKESVVMRASGGLERRIRFDEIAHVKSEVSSAGDVLAQSRPFRRIAVYPKHDPKGYVDISLRHFQMDDIQELLNAIRKSRPDLEVPTI